MKRKLIVAVALLSGIAVGAFFMLHGRVQHKGMLSALRTSAAVTVYQWRDQDGRLQVSDEPPTDGTEYKTLNVVDSLSRMDTYATPQPPPDPAASIAEQTNPASVYTPSGAKKLVENAVNVTRVIHDREAEMKQKVENTTH